MSSEKRFEFTKENIDIYLKELAKEYRRQSGKRVPAELILIGGASVLINYGFRNMTTGIDAIIQAATVMKDAINIVGDRYNLPNGWLNADFKRTDSYTPKLEEFSVYYRTYSNVLTIRTISAEYLVAMKLRSGRQYKSDLSDVLGILAYHSQKSAPITMEQIQKAVSDLYGEWDSLPQVSKDFIDNVMSDGHFEQLYEQIAQAETETQNLLRSFDHDYSNVINESNVDLITENLQKKADKDSILTLLKKKLQSEK